MSQAKASPQRQVPTLTEVVQLTPPEALDAPLSGPTLAPPAMPAALEAAPVPAYMLPGGEEQITQRVLVDLQRQVDMMLEYRLRETLTPALARMADQLIRDTRVELAATLRDVVARAVAQELARQRGR
ncbi:hypothetical protein [Eleftheria terrae]|uniref:hypothetical protein n=1 Tax=Eleftheria terrae TaxID=1597781 RepID=UPI00263B30B8|nr:hypothetical protein [Eleftheria terrae]WKB52948.1 hypothetical protein N7L95_00665 [Eleftheria terrae]